MHYGKVRLVMIKYSMSKDRGSGDVAGHGSHHFRHVIATKPSLEKWLRNKNINNRTKYAHACRLVAKQRTVILSPATFKQH